MLQELHGMLAHVLFATLVESLSVLLILVGYFGCHGVLRVGALEKGKERHEDLAYGECRAPLAG